MPDKPYLVLPEVSSERRMFIPFGCEQPETLCSNLVKVAKGASLFHFGVLTSTMHNAWVRNTCGRLKSDFRYSKDIVYNNFPWPDLPSTPEPGSAAHKAKAIVTGRLVRPADHATCVAQGPPEARRGCRCGLHFHRERGQKVLKNRCRACGLPFRSVPTLHRPVAAPSAEDHAQKEISLSSPPPSDRSPSILDFTSAPASRVYCDPGLADDFVTHILGLDPRACLITDRSSLGDFVNSQEEYDAIRAAIESRYKVKFVGDEIGDDQLAAIFEYLQKHAPTDEQAVSRWHGSLDLDNLKNRQVHISTVILQELVSRMPAEQTRYLPLMAKGIKNPDEVWIQRDRTGPDVADVTWFRTCIARFLVSDETSADSVHVVTVTRFHLRASWEIFDMKALIGDEVELVAQLNAHFRYGDRIFSRE